jgi:hypothetical protein
MTNERDPERGIVLLTNFAKAARAAGYFAKAAEAEQAAKAVNEAAQKDDEDYSIIMQAILTLTGDIAALIDKA